MAIFIFLVFFESLIYGNFAIKKSIHHENKNGKEFDLHMVDCVLFLIIFENSSENLWQISLKDTLKIHQNTLFFKETAIYMKMSENIKECICEFL